MPIDEDLPRLSPRKKRKKRIKDILRLAVLALIFILAALALKQPYVREELFNIDVIRARLRGMGWYSSAIFILASAVINAFGFPRLWISAVAGTLYGAVEGTLLAMVGTLLGSTINFIMGRSLLRGPLKRHMPAKMQQWYEAFNKRGFFAILYIRLFPFSNSTLTNFIGGASQVRYRDFLAASILGYLPFTIAFATLGSSAAKQSKWQLLGGLLMFAAVGLGQWWYMRRRTRKAALSNPPAADDQAAAAANITSNL